MCRDGEVIEDLNRYEALPTEPLHDLANHLIHLLGELPELYTSRSSKAEAKRIIASCTDSTGRLAMYREAVIKIYKRLQKELPNENVAILLSSYINMQRILYAPESKRTASSILRLCAQSFIHFSLLSRMKSIGNKCHLFGKYQHCLAAHATQMYRVTSGYSANTGWLNPKIPSSYVRNIKASLQNWKI